MDPKRIAPLVRAVPAGRALPAAAASVAVLAERLGPHVVQAGHLMQELAPTLAAWARRQSER